MDDEKNINNSSLTTRELRALKALEAASTLLFRAKVWGDDYDEDLKQIEKTIRELRAV